MVMFCTFQVWKKMVRGNYSDNYVAGNFFCGSSKRINSICDLGVFVNCLFYPLLNMQLIWDRALGLPIERPKSMTFEYIENYCKSKVA
jgi:hypothetical protein